MFKENFPSLNKSIKKLKGNPQLWYTIFVAFLIFIAFSFVVYIFTEITRDTQSRMINDRVTYLQDAFAEFASDYLQNDVGYEDLRDKIKNISAGNETIKDFKVVKFEGNSNVIVASLLLSEVGKLDTENDQQYRVAKIEIGNTNSNTDSIGGDVVVSLTRVITDDFGNPIGAVLISQNRTQADVMIDKNIQTSIYIFIFIILLIMFIFFRNARIVDYGVLYKKIKEVDQLKDDFISMASHELRTPLTVIRGYAENLIDPKVGKMTKNQKLSAERIDIAARQLDNLVNDMLDVSRIEQGRMKMELSLLLPKQSIIDAVSGFVKVAKDKGLRLNIKQDLEKETKIKADPDKFRQVVVNLVGNAIKYTKEGEVNVETKIIDDKVEIRVSDSGIGMSAEEQKDLFKKFYRVKNDDTKEVRGTGLGLWITKQIVELMNGTIVVESIKGVGTHFIVTFPQAK